MHSNSNSNSFSAVVADTFSVFFCVASGLHSTNLVAMLLKNGLAGSACKHSQTTVPVRSHVVPIRAAMSMRRVVTPPSKHSGQRLAGQAVLRPGNASRRPTVQTRAFFNNIFKQDSAEKTRKQHQERVDAINALEPRMQSLSDDQLRAKTKEFQRRVQGGEKLLSVLPEAFAVSSASPVAADILAPLPHNTCIASNISIDDLHCSYQLQCNLATRENSTISVASQCHHLFPDNGRLHTHMHAFPCFLGHDCADYLLDDNAFTGEQLCA